MSGQHGLRNSWRAKWGRVCLYGAAFALGNDTAGAAATEMCRAQIEVQLTPDVSNPRDPSFLSALAANPLYQLLWVRGTDPTIVYELRGPATDYNCEGEIKLLKRDAHVQNLRVLDPGSEDSGGTVNVP
jgi:hypothetical protein